MAPTRRVMASALGKMPTTSVRRLISPLRRSSGLVRWIFGRWSPAFGSLSRGQAFGEAHEGENIGFGLIHQHGELCHLGSELIGHLTPLGAGRFSVFLGKGGGDEGGNDTPAVLAGMGQHIAHEVHPATLPGGVQNFGNRRLEPLMRIRDHQLDAAQAAPGQRAQELDPEGLGLGGPIVMPSTSRRPSLLTATARMTAAETMRPLVRTFTQVASSQR
jgi:hypothetical protein